MNYILTQNSGHLPAGKAKLQKQFLANWKRGRNPTGNCLA